VHRFGSLDAKQQQRYYVGIGPRKFQFKHPNLNWTETNQLKAFWESMQGPVAVLHLHRPERGRNHHRRAGHLRAGADLLRVPAHGRPGRTDLLCAAHETSSGEQLPTQLPTQRRIFGAQTDLFCKNISSVIKELVKAGCLRSKRSVVRIHSGVPVFYHLAASPSPKTRSRPFAQRCFCPRIVHFGGPQAPPDLAQNRGDAGRTVWPAGERTCFPARPSLRASWRRRRLASGVAADGWPPGPHTDDTHTRIIQERGDEPPLMGCAEPWAEPRDGSAPIQQT